jgi:spore coat polysaccharide biosynthesis protein SpsF
MPRKKKPVVGAVIQARLGSSRLPGKVLRPLAGKPLLEHVIERLRLCERVDTIVLATTEASDDAELVAFAKQQGIACVRGSEQDVLSRFRQAATEHKLDIIVRICSDSPLIDWVYIDRMIERVIEKGYDYSIYDEKTPSAAEGFEVVTVAALDRVAKITDNPADHEHVTIYIRQHPGEFKVYYQRIAPSLQGEYRMSVDVHADYHFMQRIYDALYQPGKPIDLRKAVAWLNKNPGVSALNRHVKQKAVDAEAKGVVFLLSDDAMRSVRLRRNMGLMAHLAEKHHAVVTVAVVRPLDELDFLTENGFRVATLLSTEGKLDQAVMFRIAKDSGAKLAVIDETIVGEATRRRLERAGMTVAPFTERPEAMSKHMEKAYRKA